jgi:hypothetical protein
MKRCAHCGQPLPIPREGVIILSEYVAGVRPDVWVGLQFCAPRCAFNCGAALARAMAGGHTLALEPDQFDALETLQGVEAYSPELLN